MPGDPRDRPGPPRRRRDTGAGDARPATGGGERTVGPRPTRSMLIIPARRLPAGAVPVDLREVLRLLRRVGVAQVHPIGGENAPEAIAASLTEQQIAALRADHGPLLSIVENTPFDQ